MAVVLGVGRHGPPLRDSQNQIMRMIREAGERRTPPSSLRLWWAKMRAVSAGRGRTPADVGGHDVSGSVGRDGRCGMTADSHGTRRTRSKLVNSQLLCHLNYRPQGRRRSSARSLASPAPLPTALHYRTVSRRRATNHPDRLPETRPTPQHTASVHARSTLAHMEVAAARR